MTHASAGQASPLAHTLDTSSHFPVISPGLPATPTCSRPARHTGQRLGASTPLPAFLDQGGAS